MPRRVQVKQTTCTTRPGTTFLDLPSEIHDHVFSLVRKSGIPDDFGQDEDDCPQVLPAQPQLVSLHITPQQVLTWALSYRTRSSLLSRASAQRCGMPGSKRYAIH